jgi:cytosine/adenosine deaminase-related metal-dependent hydrolase
MPLQRRWTFAAACSVLAVAVHGQAPPQLPPAVVPFVSVNAPRVALTHATLVDGTGAPAQTDQTVLLDGARIMSVGPSAAIIAPAGAQVLDLTGHTLLPGLVGLHEHTYFGGGDRVTPMNSSGPLLYLAHGVTTAMTAGSMLPYHELSLKRAVDAGLTPGPRFLIAGPYLDGDASRNPMSLKVPTPESARRAIAYWAAEGTTWIKFLTNVKRDVLRAGIEAAHARGLRVTGHLCSVTFTEAAALGIDLLQHGFITNTDYIPGKQPDVCPPGNQIRQVNADIESTDVQASIRAIVKSGAAVASTLSAYESFVPGRAIDPRGLEFLAPDTRAETERLNAGLATAAFNVPPLMVRKMMAWERAFVAAGGLLGSGVDPWATGVLPGVGNLRNYELLVQAGFTPEQAVQIMTLNGARILREDRRIGSIAAGKNADLVVVRGDVVRTPAAIYDVVTVFKDGVGFDPARLRAAARGRVGLN